MSTGSSDLSAAWVTKRSHLQVSHSEVLPVVFKARKATPNISEQSDSPVPRAFPITEVGLSESLPVVREWLAERLERMYRVGTVNVKPGSLETPDVLRNRTYRFTVWFEPTAATFALMTSAQVSGDTDKGETFEKLDGFTPTPQTLFIVGELGN